MRKIYRSVDFGGLTTLHMLDTRLSGPDKQVEFTDLLNPATAAAMATLASPTRTQMGATQLGWLQGQMAASKATWQVRGQQVRLGRTSFPASVLAALNPSDTSANALAGGQKPGPPRLPIPSWGDLAGCFFSALEFLDYPQETGYQRSRQALGQTDHMHMCA